MLSSFTAWGEVWRNHLSPSNPVGSRWAVLADAIEVFLAEAANYNPPPRTALVTWASNYTMPVSPATVFHAAVTNVPIPPHMNANWDFNRAHVTSTVQQLGQQPMMGVTNLSAGLDQAVAALSVPQAGLFANKVVILMTDGQWNDGRDPIAAATDARNAGIIVHAVTMLTAHQPIVEQIAALSQRPSPTARKDDCYPWTATRTTARDDLRRRGASIILVLAMPTTFAILAAITIDYAYMGLVQTELRIATDGGKSGCRSPLPHRENQ